MVNESKSSNRTLVIVLALAALLLAVVAGVFIVVSVFGSDDSGEGAALSESARLMPDDTYMYVTFNPHLDQAENFAVVDQAWGDNPLVRMGLVEFLTSMREEGLDYKTDIEPWLGGEISLGMTGDIAGLMFQGVEMSLGSTPGKAPQLGDMPQVPGFILVAATKDRAASDRFLGKLKAEAEQDGVVWQETEYKGVPIVYFEPETDHDASVAYATVDDFVVLAVGGLEQIQTVIDARDGANLSQDPNYLAVLEKLPANQIGYGYMDVGAYIDAALEAVEAEMTGLSAELLNPDQLSAFKGAGFSAGLESNGLRVDFVGVYDKDALPKDLPGTQASTSKLVERMPANTLFYLSGSGLGSVVQTGLDAIQSAPDLPPDFDEQMQMVTALLGVSVEELIDMLSGEFALAIVHDPAGIGGDSSVPVGAVVMIEAKDEAKFEKLLDSLSMLLAFGGEMDFPKENINGVEVTMVTDPSNGNMIAGWGVGQGVFAVGTSRELLATVLGGGGDKLTDAAAYKAAVAPLPEEKAGMVYLDLDGVLRMAGEAMDAKERGSFEQARPLFAPIKAMSVALEPLDSAKDSMSGTIFVLIESE